jgi:Tfp pilus assembly protein PilO
VLKAQDASYRQSQKDLKDMAAQQYQPDNFFSQDITLVKEIEELEALGQTSGVTLTLNGISGTINTVPKAKAQGELFTVPYSISVSGPYNKVVDFIETLENLDFITPLGTLSLSSSGGTVSASMSASFYIRRHP